MKARHFPKGKAGVNLQGVNQLVSFHTGNMSETIVASGFIRMLVVSTGHLIQMRNILICQGCADAGRWDVMAIHQRVNLVGDSILHTASLH